jgi:hypothetical protein
MYSAMYARVSVSPSTHNSSFSKHESQVTTTIRESGAFIIEGVRHPTSFTLDLSWKQQ